MPFVLTEEQRALADSVRELLAAAAPRAAVRELATAPAHDAGPAWAGLAEMGALGALVAEAQGGLGLGLADLAGVLEVTGGACYPGPFVSSAVAGTLAVRDVAAGARREELLGELAGGGRVATLALHEPSARAEWRSPGTSVQGGRVTGAKVDVPHAAVADTLLVVARDADGLGLYAVERRAEGVTVAADDTVDLSRPTATVTLAGAAGERLHAGDAASALAGVVDAITVALCADGYGAAAAALDLARGYALTREQFGVVVGTFQAVQHLLVDAWSTLEAGAAVVQAALRASDPEELHRRAAAAKAWSSDGFAAVAASAVQVFGGIGFTWEHEVGLLYKRLLAAQETYGGTAHHLAEVAALALERV